MNKIAGTSNKNSNTNNPSSDSSNVCGVVIAILLVVPVSINDGTGMVFELLVTRTR